MTMRTGDAYVVERVPVRPELEVEDGHDYADCFEVRLAHPDDHTAEEWMRAALTSAAPWVVGLIRFVHGRIARFSLSTDPTSILGWETVSSVTDACRIQTRGPALRAEIVARRTSATTATVTTFLFYRRRSTRLLWLVIGPLHRRIAPYLLARAAAHLTTQAPRPPTSGGPGRPDVRAATSRRSGPAS